MGKRYIKMSAIHELIKCQKAFNELQSASYKALNFIRNIAIGHHDCCGVICYPCEAEKFLKSSGETE